MQIFRSIEEMRKWRAQVSDLSFVPTMGALHEGHLALMRGARSKSETVLASIYVNPTQFNEVEDFKSYPRNEKDDLEKLRKANVDAVFLPNNLDGEDVPDYEYQLPSRITAKLCALNRSGHFEGVAQVVSKFFHIVSPDRAFFGLKDYQQCEVIKFINREFGVELNFVPTARDHGGLALSSRNERLGEESLLKARSIYKSLHKGRDEILKSGDIEFAKSLMRKELSGLEVEYCEVLDSNLEDPCPGKYPLLLAIAAKCDGVRLIDSLLICNES